SKRQVVAEIAAGSQGVVVIPLQRVATGPGPGVVPTGRPITSVYVPMVKPPPPPIDAYFALGGSVLAPGPHGNAALGDVPRSSSGAGFSAFYERRFGKTAFGLATRLEYSIHSESHGDDINPKPFSVSGSEVVALGGIRTMGSRTIHGRVGLGFTI